MSNFSDYIGGSGGGGGGAAADKLNLLIPASGLKLVITESFTYTPSIDCTVVVTLIGGGGGGGRIVNQPAYVALGGGAGAVCQSELNLTSGTAYTITVGARGSGSTSPNAGGNSTFTGSDITDMAANGGAAGNIFAIGTDQTIAGGTATGGNIANHQGGSTSTLAAGQRGSTGGGACGFFGAGESMPKGTAYSATAGAGIDLFPTDLIANGDIFVGSAGGTAGTQGVYISSNYYSYIAGDGDFGCGGGGAYWYASRTSSSSYALAGNGGIGAGGGGAFGYNSNASYNAAAWSGYGGTGLVFLHFA